MDGSIPSQNSRKLPSLRAGKRRRKRDSGRLVVRGGPTSAAGVGWLGDGLATPGSVAGGAAIRERCVSGDSCMGDRRPGSAIMGCHHFTAEGEGVVIGSAVLVIALLGSLIGIGSAI